MATSLPFVYTVTSQATPGTGGAGAVIATMTVAAGVYALAFGAYLSTTGTILAADADNMALQTDPITALSFVTAQVLLVAPSASVPVVLFHLPVYAMSVIRIIAVGNASANTVYHASIAAAYPGPVGALI